MPLLTWNHIDWGDNINKGETNLGFPFYEVEIKGWNDEEHYSDLESLIAIKVINTYSSIDVKMDFLHPDARTSFNARKLARETKDYLVASIKSGHP